MPQSLRRPHFSLTTLNQSLFQSVSLQSLRTDLIPIYDDPLNPPYLSFSSSFPLLFCASLLCVCFMILLCLCFCFLLCEPPLSLFTPTKSLSPVLVRSLFMIGVLTSGTFFGLLISQTRRSAPRCLPVLFPRRPPHKVVLNATLTRLSAP